MFNHLSLPELSLGFWKHAGVPAEPSLPKSGSPTIQKNIASFHKIGVPAPKMGFQNCKSSVIQSTAFILTDAHNGILGKLPPGGYFIDGIKLLS